MISLGARHFNTTLGVIITASHNPPAYNGYKLKGNFGGPLLPWHISEVEGLIPDFVPEVPEISPASHPLCEKVDLEGLYLQRVQESFDLEAIKKSGFRFAYDAMYGAGRGVMPKILPGIDMLHGTENPNFAGTPPEPILKNLGEFSRYIREAGNIRSGLATDGDADRIGLFDSKGEFVDSHHIILLLIHYLVKYKGFRGKVVTAFSVTDKVKKMCEYYDLEQETVKIGFKYVAGFFLTEDVLLGGEESGGIAVKGHIPERDGIWMGLIIWEFMAKSGKTLEELIEEIYEIVGPFKYDRNDLHISPELKERVMAKCADGGFTSIAGKPVSRVETTDGFKFHFPGGEWLMIRASGTEPVLRVYAEAADRASVSAFLSESVKEILAS
jgi:phosphomannomutase